MNATETTTNKLPRSFGRLNATQFLGAMNDNIQRLNQAYRRIAEERRLALVDLQSGRISREIFVSDDIYRQEQESTDFITRVPTTFDESVPLDGRIAEYAVIARRKGGTWYVGAMTNWTPRDLTIDLSFLKPGRYQAVQFADGVNADREATDYTRTVGSVSAGDKLKVRLAPGGGWAAILSPQ